jgi:hypothetical protein
MRRNAHVMIAGLLVLLAGGCGAAEDGAGTASTTTARPRPATRAPATASKFVTSGQDTGPLADAETEAAVRAVGNRFATSMVRHDADGVCATVVPADRRAVAKKAGSCAVGIHAIFAQSSSAQYADWKIEDVHARDGYAFATLDTGGVVRTGESGLIAQRVGGRWLLVMHALGSSKPQLSSRDVRVIRALTTRYLHALVAQRWSAACATRTPSARRRLGARAGGSCEADVEQEASGNGALKSLRAGDVEVEDTGAVIVGILKGHDDVAYADFTARRAGTRWLLDGPGGPYGNTYGLP